MELITYHQRVRTIEEAWLSTMRTIMDKGREYRKDGGNRAGLLRKALDLCIIEITHPETRPLTPMNRPGCISMSSDDEAQKYLEEYLYTTEEPADHETYTYAQFLTPQVHLTAKHFAKAGFYNQHCVMQVGRPGDIEGYFKEGSSEYSIPCLRMIDCRIIKDEKGIDRLCYYVYFRAWNHFGALPTNLAGIQLLKEIHCSIIEHESGKTVEPGPTFAMSKDLHINEIEWAATAAWLGR